MSESEAKGAKSAGRELALLAVTYLSILVGTMWWSGTVTAPSMYDKYLVRLEGVGVRATDLGRSIGFYRDVLSFEALQAESAGEAGFMLPDRRKLFLRVGAEQSKAEVVLRVRNGFFRIFEKLTRRIGGLPKQGDLPSISAVLERPWGEEFVVRDYDGNEFIFFLPVRRSATRLK